MSAEVKKLWVNAGSDADLLWEEILDADKSPDGRGVGAAGYGIHFKRVAPQEMSFGSIDGATVAPYGGATAGNLLRQYILDNFMRDATLPQKFLVRFYLKGHGGTITQGYLVLDTKLPHPYPLPQIPPMPPVLKQSDPVTQLIQQQREQIDFLSKKVEELMKQSPSLSSVLEEYFSKGLVSATVEAIVRSLRELGVASPLPEEIPAELSRKEFMRFRRTYATERRLSALETQFEQLVVASGIRRALFKLTDKIQLKPAAPSPVEEKKE